MLATPASAFSVREGDAKHMHAKQNIVVFTHGQPSPTEAYYLQVKLINIYYSWTFYGLKAVGQYHYFS